MTLVGATNVLTDALNDGAFSAVSAEVGTAQGPTWTYADGRLTFDQGAPSVDRNTIFDLASLTKVLATATVGVRVVAGGRLDPEARVKSLVPEWQGIDRAAVTVRDLFEHSSGLPAHRPYFERLRGRPDYQAAIAAEPLDYAPGTSSIYSDLGFILLGFILEDAGRSTLDRQFREWCDRAEIGEPIAFRPAPDWHLRTAATGRNRRHDRVPADEPHDENAAALHGIAAHAGLFGTAGAVGEIARWWLSRLLDNKLSEASTVREFVRRSAVAGSSRAMGWDTMLTTSSCGTRLSARAIGHTGFTGTSLWIDPGRDLYAVLLTNFVLRSTERERIRQIRRDFHDRLAADLIR